MTAAAHLLRALRMIAPGALIGIIDERPWFSLTLDGTQLRLSAILQGQDHERQGNRLETLLASHMFDLRGQLVADIAVTERLASACETRLIIEALLIAD